MKEQNQSISIVRVLKQITDTIKQHIENEFKEMDLTGSQGMLIGILAHNGAMKVSDLSRRMGISSSTVSGIIDRLEKRGMVERTRSKEDRRVVNVTITSNFKKISEKHFMKVEKKIDSILSEAPSEEVDKIFEGLDILKKLMERNKLI